MNEINKKDYDEVVREKFLEWFKRVDLSHFIITDIENNKIFLKLNIISEYCLSDIEAYKNKTLK